MNHDRLMSVTAIPAAAVGKTRGEAPKPGFSASDK
jgi:hypothetical protein